MTTADAIIRSNAYRVRQLAEEAQERIEGLELRVHELEREKEHAYWLLGVVAAAVPNEAWQVVIRHPALSPSARVIAQRARLILLRARRVPIGVDDGWRVRRA